MDFLKHFFFFTNKNSNKLNNCTQLSSDKVTINIQIILNRTLKITIGILVSYYFHVLKKKKLQLETKIPNPKHTLL